MATPDSILVLRQYTNETDTEDFSDQQLSDFIDERDGDIRSAAGVVWSIKAAGYAEMVDVTEGSSTRKLSGLYQQALAMSAHWSQVTDDGVTADTTMRAGKTRPIVRP